MKRAAGAYYNEFDPFAAAWLRELIKKGLIAPGDVDERSIADVQPDDLRGYVQCHFFAGIGGWSYAARLAGWPDDRLLWTGSCPCQPFSVAGKGAGTDDPRHLWPHFFRLIRAGRPPVVMGEQVAGKAGYGWLDGVLADLAGEDYAGRGVDIPACAVDAPHIRQRLYWIAKDRLADTGREPGRSGPNRAEDGIVGADAHGTGAVANPIGERPGGRSEQPAGHDGDWAAARREKGANRAAGGDEGDVADADGALRRLRDEQRPGQQPVDEQNARDRLRAGPGDGGNVVDPSGFGRGEGWPEPELRGGRSAVARADAPGVARGDANCPGLEVGPRERGDPGAQRPSAQRAGLRNGTFWSDAEWIACHDGKARRAEPGVSLLAHGVPARVAKWRGFGNAIVPQVAAEVIAAFMEAEPYLCIEDLV